MSFFPCWSWPQLDLTLMEFSSNGWSSWVFNQSSSTIFKWIIFYLTLNQNVHQWLLVLSIWCASPTCESEVLNPHSLFECDANLKICLDDCLASPLHWIADLIFWFLHRLCTCLQFLFHLVHSLFNLKLNQTLANSNDVFKSLSNPSINHHEFVLYSFTTLISLFQMKCEFLCMVSS